MAKDFIFTLKRFGGLRSSVDDSRDLREGESPDMLNFRVTQGGKLQKRPGFCKIVSEFGIRGIWYGSVGGRTRFVAVVQDCFFCSERGFDEMEPLHDTEIPGTGTVQFFLFCEKLYLLTGEGIRVYDGETLREPEPYVPLIMVATEPSGAGTPFEDVNLLTRTVRQSFSPTGVDHHFYPAYPVVSRVLKATLNGEVIPEDRYYWDPGTCCFYFAEAPEQGTDTLEITYVLPGEDVSHRITHCRFALGFGGANDTRAFLYGNPDLPAIRYHSGVVDGKPCAEYFPETGYTMVGNGSPVTSILRHYDRQLIFTREAAYYSYLEYMTGSEDRLIASFPVLPLSDDRGNLPEGQALLVENDPCTVTDGGIYRWVSTNVRDERNAVCFSSPIGERLRGERLERAKLFNRKETEELYLFFDGRIYVYHYRLKLFYYYEFPVSVLAFCATEDGFYFATREGIYREEGTEDDGEAIPAYWRSRKFTFGEPSGYKNVYHAVLAGRGSRNTRVSFSLEGRGRPPEERELSFSDLEEVEGRAMRVGLRAVSHASVLVRADGKEPFHLFGLELRGRITDQRIKE